MEQIILFIFLSLFPFGQIIRIGVVQPIDVVVGLGAAWAILKNFRRPKVFKYLNNFLLVALFSWIFSLFTFWRVEVLYGGLYLLRLAAYIYFFLFVFNFAQRAKANKELLLNSLLLVSSFSAIFGWIQYIIYPSIKFLFAVGWDEHLFRLVGTFLDPTFLGLIIVFGLLIAIYQYVVKQKGGYLLLGLFLTISLAFTYSRASYLAFFAGITVLLAYYRKFKYLMFLILGFFVVMLILPTSKNHILGFTRQFSAIARVENYFETYNIFKTSPLIGVGYDNLCLAKEKATGYVNFASHACSGSDSSILFILATTGILGLASFVWVIVRAIQYTKFNILFISVVVAVFVHSLFSNSTFYAWIMGYLAILLTVYLGREIEG